MRRSTLETKQIEAKQKAMDMEIVEKLHSESSLDLEPTDPSTGFIQSQGHYILHAAYWFILTFVVEFIDEDSYKCFAQKKRATGALYFEEVESFPIINTVGIWVKYLHAVCFVVMLLSNVWVPKKMTSNSLAIKLILNFITVPLYIFIIFWFESGLEDLRYKFDKTSTLDNPVLYNEGTMCVSKDMGNIE